MTQASTIETEQSTPNKDKGGNMFKVAPESIAAKVFMAFLTTAGIFYINIMLFYNGCF